MVKKNNERELKSLQRVLSNNEDRLQRVRKRTEALTTNKQKWDDFKKNLKNEDMFNDVRIRNTLILDASANDRTE